MPAITVTGDLTNPTSSLTAGTKYVVQNQGYASVRMVVSTSAINAKTQDSLTLATMTSQGMAQLEYTHAASKNVGLWAEGGESVVVFHKL